MLSELITWVLNTYLGKYLEDFNPAQMSVALLSGEVELENVPIRKDALTTFGIPVQALSGNIGKIKLQIPVRQFRTAPWSITIERVYGVFAPKDLNEWDDEKEKFTEYLYKQSKLDAKEAKWRAEQGYINENFYSSSYSSWINYGTSLATNILEGLELRIIDVHIRYEDSITIPDTMFCTGIKINSLTVQTCDTNWIVGGKFLNKNLSCKLIELNDLSIYWDQLDIREKTSIMNSNDLLIKMEAFQKYNHHFILNPISARAQFKRERCEQAIRDKERPRISCDILIGDIEVDIDDVQYNQIINCIYGLQQINKFKKYRLMRPTCSVSQNPVLWWKYAAKCCGYCYKTKTEKRKTIQENLRYIRIYKQILINPNEIVAEDKTFKVFMEKSRILDELQMLRNICFFNLHVIDCGAKPKNTFQGKSMLFRWFPNWLGWYGSGETSKLQIENDESIKAIEADILSALNDTMTDTSLSKHDVTFAHFTFNLARGVFFINTAKTNNIRRNVNFELEFETLLSSVEMTPRFSSYSIEISLGSVYMRDKFTRESKFPFLIKPQIEEIPSSAESNVEVLQVDKTKESSGEPWFQIQYKSCPSEKHSDYRLTIKMKSSDIVYNKDAFLWLKSFFISPLNRKFKTQSNCEDTKTSSRLQFLQNWKHLLIGYKEHRKTWSLEIDISAPRIIFFENFLKFDTLMVLVDFGRFQLLKNELNQQVCDNTKETDYNKYEANSEDSELFMTPCSTPPGSENSNIESPTTCFDTKSISKLDMTNDTGLEEALHNKIYDVYIINLTELQVLVCKNTEKSMASSKTSSKLHLVDKFNIQLLLEHRIMQTTDPEYPSIKLSGTLPKIVAHVNEHNIEDFLNIMDQLTMSNFSENIINTTTDINSGDIYKTSQEQNNLDMTHIVLQFLIGQLILEIQSYGKGIAELQIVGAKAGITKRVDAINVNMSVHSLLLVDAIQTLGPDFELLFASHRHVGMDSISGSLKKSEPCSPIHTESPEYKETTKSSSPQSVNKNMIYFQRGIPNIELDFEDNDALICINIDIKDGDLKDTSSYVVSVSFNSLDIIANQETIVEVLGFLKRIHSIYATHTRKNEKHVEEASEKCNSIVGKRSKNMRAEISFDFNKLNILILRTVEKENVIVGRKVGTLTIIEARIRATLETDTHVSGSLGGVQLINITPEGILHQRILSVGKDPLMDRPLLKKIDHNIYDNTDRNQEQNDALSFEISRKIQSDVSVKVRMASVWYIHCATFIQEINSCIYQFKHHLKNFAKSIRDKATDMAREFVNNLNEVESSDNLENLTSCHQKQISLDIILNSPVVVLPKSSYSTDVLVANLGKITIYNKYRENDTNKDKSNNVPELYSRTEVIYYVDVRNINLFSLNTSGRKDSKTTIIPKAEEYYSCKTDAIPILHDTAMLFKLTRKFEEDFIKEKCKPNTTFMVEGSVTQVFRIAFTRNQLKQMQQSIKNAAVLYLDADSSGTNNVDLTKEPNYIANKEEKREANTNTNLKFSVPVFIMDLKTEDRHSFINITFREFGLTQHNNATSKKLQVHLRSILVEDLKRPHDSKFRNIVDSSSEYERNPCYQNYLCSKSCPNLTQIHCKENDLNVSMPSILDDRSMNVVSNWRILHRNETKKIENENLVIYKSKSKKDVDGIIHANSSINFNCLNLTISVERWLMIFDFFDLVSTNNSNNHVSTHDEQTADAELNSESELKVIVRCLNLILLRNDSELTKANISNAIFKISKKDITKSVEGRLGSISLYDLTAYGNMYRQKFSTLGPEALSFKYTRINNDKQLSSQRSLEKNAELQIQMSSVRYIHTKRFLVELQSFIKELLQLQTPVMKKMKMPEKEKRIHDNNFRMGLEIYADMPIIILPLSFHSNHVIFANLGKLSLKNSFHFSSSKNDTHREFDEILDKMSVDIANINLFAGQRITKASKMVLSFEENDKFLTFENFMILKTGISFFKESCHLKLEIDRNTNSDLSHNCPDLSVRGTLSELNGLINIPQYKIIRGFLDYNLGEKIDDVYYKYSFNICESLEKLSSINKTYEPKSGTQVWTTIAITLTLENVCITLSESLTFENEARPLACVNFIKSWLKIDSFSDGSQDVDLLSTEIVVMDSRQCSDMMSENVFKNILQHSQNSHSTNIVQAEIHSRKKNDSSKYTILLNNMRLIAIIPFLEKLKSFIKEEAYVSSIIKSLKQKTLQGNTNSQQVNQSSLELVLNITNSELVLVENANQTDSNAIVLKNTSVLSYKPNDGLSPISVDINHLEIFSCVLGCENESALSIIDPFKLNMELRENCFNITIQKQLNIRLSYHDFKLLIKMFQLLPKRKKEEKIFTNNFDFELIAPLIAMGFTQKDCWYAMEVNNYKLNDAAKWLLQQKQDNDENKYLDINKISIDANHISVCVIDDCKDADVPLLEISISHVRIEQALKSATHTDIEPYEGSIKCTINSDYFNRLLSGWEPIIEPWECASNWKFSETKSRVLRANISSKQLLKCNITSTMIDLWDIVKNNWTMDYFSSHPSNNSGLANFKQRIPFIPFALKNLTGEPLLFKTINSQLGSITRTEVNQQDIMSNWIPVQNNETVSFDFGPHSKLRHLDSHQLNIHQIYIQIHGWTLIGPISIDKVGIYFRYATLDIQFKKKTRIVFDISLVGSAQKLVTVKSALSIVNNLSKRILLKMETKKQDEVELAVIEPNEHLSLPLRLSESLIYFKPLSSTTTNSKIYDIILNDKNRFMRKKSLSLVDIGTEDTGFCGNGITWMNCTKVQATRDMHSCFGQNKSIFHAIIEIRRDCYPNMELSSLPGHTILILPPLKIKNVLSCDLFFKISGRTQGRINSMKIVNIYNVNVHDSFLLSITLDNYKLSGQVKIPMGHTGIVEPKLKLIDMLNRELFLRVSIQCFQGKGMEIFISAPIWMINKTGLPLVFRQEGTNTPVSGQFEEHENARVVSPLMLSFSDQDGSPSLEIRLGKIYGANNPWCKGFNIHKEILYRDLKTERSKGCYTIGINICRGRGAYSTTTFITFTPRFHIYNKTSYNLEFAQKCDIATNDSTTADKIISALPGCNFAFHWPNCEEEPLLCVRIVDVQFCQWSHGIPVNEARSLYINIRNYLGEMYFLRLEVLLKGATYLLLLSDAHILPPPIRIDNYSEVVITFSQFGGRPYWRTSVRPQSSLAYALDDSIGLESLQIEAPGGNAVVFPLKNVGSSQNITYANFIYIALKDTFGYHNSFSGSLGVEMEPQELVLAVKDKKVILAKKCSGDRSQLWLMNSNGQLEHEGSSPPTENENIQISIHSRFVLDLEKPPNPMQYTSLVVRPPNKQRITTQTWRFDKGRLMCHANMCVQARNGVHGLQHNLEAVLGQATPKDPQNNEDVPIEQHIEIQKLRPGSGQLEVTCRMDGPIRTLQIRDVKSHYDDIILASDPLWKHASLHNRKPVTETKKKFFDEIVFKMEISKGLGLSVITRQPNEELAYLTFDHIMVDFLSSPYQKNIDLRIKDLQIDNQLLDTPCPVLLHTSKMITEDETNYGLAFKAKILTSPNENAVIVEFMTIHFKPFVVYLEERLILKTAIFFRYGKNHESNSSIETDFEFNYGRDEISSNSKRFYFEDFWISSTQVRLTALTAPKLSRHLLETKKAIGLTLIKFEDAIIEFDKFALKNTFETFDAYVKTIKLHYINQLKWHAASILGSVDFLGNPLGFANDLSEGVSGLIFEGSVKSLVKNVTHGISNSTAKLTETLSDSLGKVVLDDRDNETRQKILEIPSNTSGSHIAAGLKGFGFGLLGGVTSIVRHTYVGAQADGVPGFLSGLGKGLVGTVTKPIIGVLDLASETANAVKESSKGSHRTIPDRKRLPRCVTGAPGGLLPIYSHRQSRGQQYLYVINRRNFSEKLMCYEPNLCNDRDAKLRLIVSTEFIRIFSRNDDDPAIMFECHLSEILSCHPLTTNIQHSATNTSQPHYYIEISTNLPKITRPRVRCQNEEIAEKASRCINYAKTVFDEAELSMINE